MTFIPHGIGIGLSGKVDVAGWERVRQGQKQLELEQRRLDQVQEQAEFEKRKSQYEFMNEKMKRPGAILSERLEREYVKNVYEPVTTEMGKMWSENAGIKDFTDYDALAKFDELSHKLMNNQYIVDAQYLQKQKDAYEAHKLKEPNDEAVKKFEAEMDAFEKGQINDVPTFMPYRFDPIGLINSVKDNIDVVYDPKTAKWLGQYAVVEGKYEPKALRNAANLIYEKDEAGWNEYLEGDPYWQEDPIKAVEYKIQQMTALEDKWLAAGYGGSGSSGSGKEKTPVKNMLVQYVTNSNYYNNRLPLASKTMFLAPQTEMEGYDGNLYPHLSLSSNPLENIFSVEVPDNQSQSGYSVQSLEVPAGLNGIIRRGNGLRFYDGSEAGLEGQAPEYIANKKLPTDQNIYTGIRVEFYDPNISAVIAPLVQSTSNTPTEPTLSAPLQELKTKLEDKGYTVNVKTNVIGSQAGMGMPVEKTVYSITADLVTPIDWSRSTDFNREFYTDSQVGEINQSMGMITQDNFSLAAVGLMTDIGNDYESTYLFLEKYAKDNNIGTMSEAAQHFRKAAKAGQVSVQSLYLKLTQPPK